VLDASDTNSVVIGLVAAELLRLAPGLRGHLLDDFVRPLLVQLFEDVGALVRRHRAHQRRRLLRAHCLEHFGAQLLVQILEHGRRAVGRQRREEPRDLLDGDRLGDIREIGRVELLGVRRDQLGRFLEQHEDVRREQSAKGTLLRVVLGWRHVTASATAIAASPSK
jgi:hypothetical protein